jgi:hypothetical protein
MLSIKRTSFLLIAIISMSVAAQSGLYQPREIRAAYHKNTRSLSGQPGEKYWQNYAYYNIDVSIDPVTKILTGSESIIYENNSPDTLKRIVFKLYQNLNKTGAARNIELPENAVTNGMKVTRLMINNSEYPDEMIRVNGTNMIVTLSEALQPGSKLETEIEWNFLIPPSSAPRMGVTDSVTYFLAYWYPRIAVYDDVQGWDIYSYDGEHEFYFDYSDYKVNITMPYGFIVWATGMPQNLEEILSDDILNKYKEASATDTVVKIVTTVDLKKGDMFRENNNNYTWRYSAENVPDFAFGTSAHYVWQMTNVKYENRVVLVQTAFNPSAETYNEVIHYAKGAVEQFKTGLPGIEYPYPQITVFNGDSGMEFPMIVNDAAFPNRATDVYVTTHEITHTFFPFYTAMSETRYNWFDEGMAYFLPQKIQLSFDPSDHRVRAARGYSNYAGKETDLPLMTPSFFIKEPDLSMISYYKSAIAFDMLRNLLGENIFKKCLHEFISRWNGRHPLPYDFFYTFNDVSGKNLDWFWQSWFFEKGYPDLGISGVEVQDNKINILIEKKGNYPVPVEITVNLQDGSKKIISLNIDIWSDEENTEMIEIALPVKALSVELGAPWIPDSDQSDNKWTAE